MRQIKSILIASIVCLPALVFGQDYHFSNFDALVTGYQPALTGMSKKYQYRAASQYRSQWRPLSTKPFATFAFSYDMPVNDRWGIGGYFANFDGAKIYNSMDLVLSSAYRISDPTQNTHLLTVGLQAGMIYNNINDRDLLFENQFENGQFNSSLSSKENFESFNHVMPEFNLGLYYKWADNANFYHPYLGLSVFHLSSPKEALLSNTKETRLERRYMANPGVLFTVNRQFTIDLKGMYQFQGEANELLLGAVGAYRIKNTETKMNLGASYRLDDAVSVLAGITYQDISFAINYDITVSTLKNFNGGRGALELTIVYRPRRFGGRDQY